VTALPLILLFGWLVTTEIRSERADAQQTALRTARATAVRLRNLDRDSHQLLTRLASRPAIRDFDGSHCDSLFAITEFFPQYATVFFFNADGALLCSGEPALADRHASSAALQWIQSDFHAHESQRMLLRQIGASLVATIAMPVDNDRSRGRSLVLVALPDVLALQGLPSGSIVALLDESGTILARSRGAEKWVGRNARGLSVTDVALERKDGSAEAVGVDGIARQYGFTYLPEVGVYVYVGIPTQSVMQPVRGTIIRAVSGGIVIILLVVFAALFVARAIERPIDRLARSADVIASAGYVEPIPAGGPREIASLGESLQRMVDVRRHAEEKVLESQSALKSLSERLLTIQEQERTRIAREIHDDLGQSLTALKMDVIGLVRAVPAGTGGAMPDRILRTIDATVTAVQRIAQELRPSVLDDLGFVPAVEAEARRFEERTGIECDLSITTGSLSIEEPMASAIYRIIQEALTNVGRHSDASRVEVRLRHRGDDLLLDVRDDGRGITEEQIADRGSLGMIGIAERASLHGGTVHVEGFPGRGTIVSVRLPLTRPTGG